MRAEECDEKTTKKPYQAADERLADPSRVVWICQLYQTELFGLMDSRTAVVDVELTVNVLGMGTHSAQGDHEFTGDLWPRKLGFEQSEHL